MSKQSRHGQRYALGASTRSPATGKASAASLQRLAHDKRDNMPSNAISPVPCPNNHAMGGGTLQALQRRAALQRGRHGRRWQGNYNSTMLIHTSTDSRRSTRRAFVDGEATEAESTVAAWPASTDCFAWRKGESLPLYTTDTQDLALKKLY